MRGTIHFDTERQHQAVKISKLEFHTDKQMDLPYLIEEICPEFLFLPVKEIVWHHDKEETSKTQ